jgi:hypothetical protein
MPDLGQECSSAQTNHKIWFSQREDLERDFGYDTV